MNFDKSSFAKDMINSLAGIAIKNIVNGFNASPMGGKQDDYEDEQEVCSLITPDKASILWFCGQLEKAGYAIKYRAVEGGVEVVL